MGSVTLQKQNCEQDSTFAGQNVNFGHPSGGTLSDLPVVRTLVTQCGPG